MKIPSLTRKKEAIDIEIERAICEMSKIMPDTPEYGVAVSNLKGLYEAKSQKAKWSISPDTMLAVAANLVGILLILNHERLNIITTKAISFLPKGRI